jgi:hypothetical protein
MGVLADRLDSMRVRASSPDGSITGELRDRTQVYLSFAPGSYRDYDEASLEEQLAGLARLLWASRMKEYYAAASEAFGEKVTKEPPPVSPRDAAFYEARDELVAEGRSADGRIHIAVRGMRTWTIRIKDGTLRALDQEAFSARVREAAGMLIDDQLTKVRALKLKFYE